MTRSIALLSLGLLAPLAAAAPPDFDTAVAANNPSLWYKFNDAPSSLTAINYGSLGAAFNGSYFAGVHAGAPTYSGDTGAAFVGTSQQYVLSNSTAPTSFTGDPIFTAEAVVFVTHNSVFGTAGYPPFLNWGTASTGRSVYFGLWRYSTTRIFAGFHNGGLRMFCENMTDNAWNHVMWVHQSGGGQWGGTTLYVNGKQAILEHDTALIGAPVINLATSVFRIQRGPDSPRYFSGTIDEVVLYDHALSAADAAAHFQALMMPDRSCLADIDDGSGTGTVDCGVTIDDLLYYLQLFTAGNIDADVDDGSGMGFRDGGVTIDDLLFYLARFAAGC